MDQLSLSSPVDSKTPIERIITLVVTIDTRQSCSSSLVGCSLLDLPTLFLLLLPSMSLVLHRCVHPLPLSPSLNSKQQLLLLLPRVYNARTGWKELETAIRAAHTARLPLKFDVEFRPFRLDPTLPANQPVDKVCYACLSRFLVFLSSCSLVCVRVVRVQEVG
jgi:hypothetical protein